MPTRLLLVTLLVLSSFAGCSARSGTATPETSSWSALELVEALASDPARSVDMTLRHIGKLILGEPLDVASIRASARGLPRTLS